ncbi:MAG: hypothetical protein QM742_08900 [Aquabacterium sp.]
MKLSGAGLAVLTLAAMACQGAMAAGYRLRTLAPVADTHVSLAHVLAPTGMALGESTVTERCPLSQWVACLVYGHTDRQPRAVLWREAAPQPQAIRCLDTTLAPVATWDLPCEATAVNSRGTMVGRSYAGLGAEGRQRVVLWPRADAAPVDLSPQMEALPEFDSARAVALNDQGWILGRARLRDTATEYAFVLHDGVAQALPNAGAVAIRPVAINATMAVGEGRYESGGQSGLVIWPLSGGAATVRGIASDVDHVYVSGLSSAGHVTGAFWTPLEGHTTQGYLWFQGRAQILQTDPGHDSRGHSVNAAGLVVGTHCASRQDIRGCRASLWTNGLRQDLNKLTTPPAGHVLVDARAINDRGQIIGWMTNPAGLMRGYLLTPVP